MILLSSKYIHGFFATLITIAIVSCSPSASFSPPTPKPQHQTSIPTGHRSKPTTDTWLQTINRTAPGDDWEAIEAASVQKLIAAHKMQMTSVSTTGHWAQRGPSNIPGRITDMDIDYANGHIYALSDHGIVFRSSDLEATQWEALNDQHPLALGVAGQLVILPDSVTSLVVSGYLKTTNGWGIRYSHDGGTTWHAPDSIGDYPIMGIRRMMRGDGKVYAFMQEYNPAIPTDYYSVYTSEDNGISFGLLYRSAIPVGDGGRHIRSDMWVSNDDTHAYMYLALEDSLFQVNKTTGTRAFKGRISNAAINQGLLTGLTLNGVTELTAYTAIGDAGKFYAWSTANQSWQYQGQLTDWWLSLPFGANSLSCSQLSADTIYFGAILTSRSTNRGQTWTTIDLDTTGSYALYHGDVPKTFNILNPLSGEEETYMGTDGGVYKLDPEEDHFNTISVPGLNCTQIYKMISKQSEPWKMGIGTQDNGYCFSLYDDSQSGISDFTFLWGGDVTQVASGDGGESFWLWWLGDGCNYMSDFDGSGLVSTWSPYDFDGSIPYWEAPVWISSHHPDRCYTAGYINDSGGNHLIELKAVPGGQAVPFQYGYNFEAASGAKISAIAVSPLDSNIFYVGTENGYVFRSTNDGANWSSIQISPSLYIRSIHPSHLNAGELWVGGSGFSNSPVYHSTNFGAGFTAFNPNLPACRAEAFAGNGDESRLFLATSIGPFVYDESEMSWSSIAGTAAPLVQYMDVEYLTATHTARFATYARGVWDYRLDCSQTPSETNTWKGPVGGNWHGSNAYWSLGHFPRRCEDVVIRANAHVNVTNGPAIEVRSLKVETGAVLNVLPGVDIYVQD